MIRAFGPSAPRVHPTAFVHDSAELIGKVEVRARASIWPLSVLRGDVDRIVVGERTNIQDLCVLHCRERRPVVLGRGVTVGHRVILHGSRVADGCLIGMGAIVLEAVLGRGCLVAAGSLVLAGLRSPPGRLIAGSPAKVLRPLTPRELSMLREGERSYLRLGARHRAGSRIVFP